MITDQRVIVLSWAAFLLVWGVASVGVKRDVRGGGYASVVWRYWALRLAVAAVAVVVAVRLATRGAADVFADRAALFTPPPLLGWLGAALSVVGISLAIWARVCLGRNWSPQPAVKEEPELVTRGPYAVIRHPIYAGMLLAALGAALTGIVFGVVVLGFAAILFRMRIGREEAIMRGLFPDEYAAYQRRTKRLIPFVW